MVKGQITAVTLVGHNVVLKECNGFTDINTDICITVIILLYMKENYSFMKCF